jgi:hypothetical protein
MWTATQRDWGAVECWAAPGSRFARPGLTLRGRSADRDAVADAGEVDRDLAAQRMLVIDDERLAVD